MMGGPNLSRIIPAIGLPNTRPIDRQERRVTEEVALAAGVRRLESELETLEAEIRRVGHPAEVRPGLLVLAYFAIVGIVAPIALLASRPVSDSLTLRRTAFLLFLSGFALLLGYIGWAARRLRRTIEEPLR
jgi:hypothetical protein